MTTATAPAVEKRKKPWTKARVILLPMSDAGINLDAYNKVFHDPTIMQSLPAYYSRAFAGQCPV